MTDEDKPGAAHPGGPEQPTGPSSAPEDQPTTHLSGSLAGGPVTHQTGGDTPAEDDAPTRRVTPWATPGSAHHAPDTPGGTPPDAPDTPRPGTIRYQDAETTSARPLSVGEQRARLRAEEEQAEQEAADAAAAERRGRTRRRLLIGSGVTVGVVALVAVGYAAASPSTVIAHCTDNSGTIVDDKYCDDSGSYYTSHGGYSNGGFFYLGGSQYHYNYGGTGTIGQHISGGSTVKPDGASISTGSGKSIQRGGFGIRSGGKSGGS
jgi:hypothetical protein